MVCIYCGAKKINKGDKYVQDTKNKIDFCSLLHLRLWNKRHLGTSFFHSVVKVVN